MNIKRFDDPTPDNTREIAIREHANGGFTVQARGGMNERDQTVAAYSNADDLINGLEEMLVN